MYLLRTLSPWRVSFSDPTLSVDRTFRRYATIYGPSGKPHIGTMKHPSERKQHSIGQIVRIYLNQILIRTSRGLARQCNSSTSRKPNDERCRNPGNKKNKALMQRRAQIVDLKERGKKQLQAYVAESPYILRYIHIMPRNVRSKNGGCMAGATASEGSIQQVPASYAEKES